MGDAKPIPVALIGYGLSFHIFHVPFITALPHLYTLRAIVQRHPTPAANAAQDYPSANVYSSTTDMLASEPSVELVVVTSIPSTHFALCQEILNAGKNIVCEKPFVATSAEARELAALAAQKGLTLSVYQNRRWDADFLSLSALLANGALGRIVEVESHFDRHRPHPPPAPTSGSGAPTSWKAKETTGGAIYDLGTHLLDQLVAAFGVPTKVTAFVGDQRVYTEPGTGGGNPGGDSFTVHLHYENFGGSGGKMLATAKAGVVSAETEQLRWWVKGTDGSFRKFNLDVQEDQLKAGRRPPGFSGSIHYGGKSEEVVGDEKFGIEDESSHGLVTKADRDSNRISVTSVGPKSPPVTYKRFYELLAEAIRGQEKNPVSANEAAKVIRLIELSMVSSNEERTVKVDIDW